MDPGEWHGGLVLPLIVGKKEEIREGSKASRECKTTPLPPSSLAKDLDQGLVSDLILQTGIISARI